MQRRRGFPRARNDVNKGGKSDQERSLERGCVYQHACMANEAVHRRARVHSLATRGREDATWGCQG